MTRRQIIFLVGVVTPLGAVLIALVARPISNHQRESDWLAFLRAHPWPSLAGLTALSIALAILATTPPATQLSVLAAADRLARAVHRDWSYEAQWRRIFDPYPLPVQWRAADPDLLAPWSSVVRLAQAGPGQSTASSRWAQEPAALAGADNDLADVLDRVPTGRIVVLGAKGTGKTILLVRLVLDLLSRRRPGQPVPILLPLASWNPSEEDLNSWIVRWLITDRAGLGGYITAGRRVSLARALLDAGMVMPVLDGLDEIPGNVRGAAIAGINDAIRPGQALVLAARTDAYRQAVHSPDGRSVLLTGAAGIELQPLARNVVADYLMDSAGVPEAARRWEPIIEAAAASGTSPVAQTLTTPLMASLARVAYNPRPGENISDVSLNPVELLNRPRFPDRESVEDYLFDRFIPASYRRHPDSSHPSRRHSWTAGQAQRWLSFMAQDLERHESGSTDIAWWRLSYSIPRHTTAVGLGVLLAFVGGLAFPFPGLGIGLMFGLSAGVLIRKLRPHDTSALARGLAGGLAGGIIAALISVAILGFGPGNYLLGSVLAAGLAVSLGVACIRQMLAAFAAGFVGEIVIAFYENSTPFENIRAAVSYWSHVPNGIGIGVAALLYVELGDRAVPARGIRWSSAWFGCGLITATVLGLISGAQEGWLAGVSVWLAGVVGSAFVGSVAEPVATDLAGAASPKLTLRRDRVTSLASSIGVGVPLGTIVGVTQALARSPAGIQNGLLFGLKVGVATFVVVGLTFGSIQALWISFVITRTFHALRRRLPWRLIKFLDDAHANRGVLRQVGAVYQFRHIELQRHLAKHNEMLRPLVESATRPGQRTSWTDQRAPFTAPQQVRHAFISYVREDGPVVDQLQRVLESAGLSVWRDTAALWPGEDWRRNIRRAITDNTLVFIACFSSQSVARATSYQNEELTLAIEQLRMRNPEVPWLIPVRFDDCPVPDFEIAAGRTLGSIQRVDLFGEREEEGLTRLLVTVRRLLGE